MSISSWARFIVGIVLSAEILRQLIFGKEISVIATTLAIIFLVLSVLYFVERFLFKT